MRILHVVPSLALGFGGPSVAAMNLCRALASQGHEVSIFTTDADIGGSSDGKSNIGNEIEGLRISYFPTALLKGYKFSPRLARALKIEIPKFDIIHIHSLFQFSTLAASYYCQKYRKPYIIRPLGHLEPTIFKRKFILKQIYLHLFEIKNLEKASFIHFTTEREMYLSRRLGIKNKSFVLSLGVSLDEFSHLPEYGKFRLKYPELKDKKIILFLSRINFKKGLDILVEAFAELSANRKDIHLVIAGPDSEGYGNKVKKWLKGLGILNRTTFTGMLLGEDKLCAFRDSDIFVLPSYSENFGLVVIEAIACGLVSVVSNNVGIHQDLQRYGAAIVVGASVKELYRGMEFALGNDTLREDRIRQGRKLIEDCYEINKISERLVKIYEQIVAGKN